MQNQLDISVLIATYNRAEILRGTLESMTCLERDGLLVEFVVVDNNSSDDTKEVVESFFDKLPIRYLFESRPGKNCALNKALREVKLGKIVVFTDDDVEPQEDWLQAVKSVSARWLDHSVFGGRIYPVWPQCDIPKWVKVDFIRRCGFSAHNYADSECLYAQDLYPFGANCWYRRNVFANGRRFCERFGPRPGGYIMGSETSFLIELAKDGYEIVYSPHAIVGHRIQTWQLSAKSIRKRAYRCGRQGPHLGGLCHRDLFDKHPFIWYLLRLAGLTRAGLSYVWALVHLSSCSRVKMSRQAMIDIGYNLESLLVASKISRESITVSCNDNLSHKK